MKKPSIPVSETARLIELKEYEVLDTPPEQQFDDLTLLASHICGTPIALISLVDESRQWFKSRQGTTATECPREVAFCAHAIHGDKVFIVEDARLDERFHDNPLVTGPAKGVFYAGAPLITPSGEKIGTICVVDHEPKKLGASQTKALAALARQVVAQLELRKLSRSQAKANHLLRSITESFPGMVAYWTKDLVCLYANSRHSEWFGLAPEDMVGKTVEHLLGMELAEVNEPYFRGVLAGELQAFERMIPKVGGKPTHNWVQYIPDIVNGEVVGFVAAVTDITLLREVESELKKQHSKLVAASKLASLGEMAAGVAHEINNPLAIICGKAGGLMRRLESGTAVDAEKTKKDLTTIYATTERIARIVKGLRSFSGADETSPMTRSDLHSIIQETLGLCGERFRVSGVDLRVQCEPQTMLECRPVQVSQILLNLLSNAFDAVSVLKEKWVAVEVTATGERIRITITDSGKGILPELAEKIMNPFFSTKPVGQGTGLGLSISLGIAKAHQGELYYDSTSSHTRFILELPVQQAMNRAA